MDKKDLADIYYQPIVDYSLTLLDCNTSNWESNFTKYLSKWATLTEESNFNSMKRVIRNVYVKQNQTKFFDTNFGFYTSVMMKDAELDLRFRGNSIATIHYDADSLVYDRIEPRKQRGAVPPKLWSIIGKKRTSEWATGKKNCTDFDLFYSYYSPETVNTDHVVECDVESTLLKLINGKAFRFMTVITRPEDNGSFFQFPTPLKASKVHEVYRDGFDKNRLKEKLSYSKNGVGGRIDILGRRGRGRSSIIQVFEVKDTYDEKEQPAYAIAQAIAYSTFLLRLIRNDSISCKEDNELSWWKIIVGDKSPENELNIEAVVVVPKKEKGETNTDFVDCKLSVPWKEGTKKDTISLKYLPFEQGNLDADSFDLKYMRY